jgi:hypothetical protein
MKSKYQYSKYLSIFLFLFIFQTNAHSQVGPGCGILCSIFSLPGALIGDVKYSIREGRSTRKRMKSVAKIAHGYCQNEDRDERLSELKEEDKELYYEIMSVFYKATQKICKKTRKSQGFVISTFNNEKHKQSNQGLYCDIKNKPYKLITHLDGACYIAKKYYKN